MHLQIAVKCFQFVSSSLFTQYCEYYLFLNSMWNLFTVCDKCSFHLMFSVARTALPPPPFLLSAARARFNYTIVMRSVSCFYVLLIFTFEFFFISLVQFLYIKNINFFGDTKREFEINFLKPNDRNHEREKSVFKAVKQKFFMHNFSLPLIFNF